MPPTLANSFAALDLEDEPAARSGSSRKKKKNKAKGGAGGGDANGTVAASSVTLAAEEAEEEAAGPAAPAPASSARAEPASSSSEPLFEPLIWIDMEMTGLEVETCAIIEIACLITDGNLERVIEGPDLVVHQPDDVLHAMNAWCVEQHGKSGLTQRVRASTTTLEAAEDAVLAFVAAHTHPGAAQLAGNSVHCDLAFLRRYMPRLAAHLHYRIVDVSSVRELAKRWYPGEMRKAPRKACEHTALADIRESLDELRWLRKAVFKPSSKK